MKFTLTIRLGNDAMQGPDDVADALADVADRLRQSAPLLRAGEAGNIRDLNGNQVGAWDVVA